MGRNAGRWGWSGRPAWTTRPRRVVNISGTGAVHDNAEPELKPPRHPQRWRGEARGTLENIRETSPHPPWSASGLPEPRRDHGTL